MNKRQLHHWLVRLRPISYWYFIGLVLLSALVAAVALRQNNLNAIKLRDKVIQTDKDNGDVEASLKELREYTYTHMNARLSSDNGIYPPIQLKYTYDRLVQKEQNRVESENKDIYAAAQKDCEARYPGGFSGSNRIPCIQEYIDKHGQQKALPNKIPDDLYKFDFVSPVWSPDIAGWALVICGISIILLISRVAAELYIKNQLS